MGRQYSPFGVETQSFAVRQPVQFVALSGKGPQRLWGRSSLPCCPLVGREHYDASQKNHFAEGARSGPFSSKPSGGRKNRSSGSWPTLMSTSVLNISALLTWSTR